VFEKVFGQSKDLWILTGPKDISSYKMIWIPIVNCNYHYLWYVNSERNHRKCMWMHIHFCVFMECVLKKSFLRI